MYDKPVCENNDKTAVVLVCRGDQSSAAMRGE